MRAATLCGVLLSIQLSSAARHASVTLDLQNDNSTDFQDVNIKAALAPKPKAALAKLEQELAQLRMYDSTNPRIKTLKKEIAAAKKKVKKANDAKWDKFKNSLDQRIERLGQEVAQQEEALRDVLIARRAEVRVEYDQQERVQKQVVEVKEQMSHDVPVIDVEPPSPANAVATDPCCDGSIQGHSADNAAADGTGMYTITVRHSGLSLSASGAPGSCRSAMSLPSVYVQYLCPQQCTPDPRDWLSWNSIFAKNDQVSEADVDDCSIDNCRGSCFNPHDTEWFWSSVVGVQAPRLRECAVVGGWRYGGEKDPQVVMTSSCRARFEVARHLLFDKLD